MIMLARAAGQGKRLVEDMAEQTIVHIHNSDGAQTIRIGVKEFKCTGTKPPFDHPHVYLDMGRDDEIVCPYCSTVFVYDPMIAPYRSDPPDCLYDIDEPA